jgi:hypothetical protein
MAQVNLNITELKTFIKHIVSNNQKLQEEGKIPVAINVEGEAGIGKTSAIIQLSEELNLDVIKLNLAQLEELGDLVGFPVKEYEVVKVSEEGKTVKWVPESTLNLYIQSKYVPTGEKRMGYAVPEWIQGKSNGGILILDDYSRADQRFVQACMELIDRQRYMSWQLPKNWHIILTSNPDNGDYQVTTMDDAQKTRFITVNLKFDIDVWAKWAESSNIDGRCINFLIMHPELVTQKVNSRSITTFFNSISSIKDFEKELPLIQMIGEGSVGDSFATMFTLFINNKLDKLMSPDKIMSQEWDTVKSQLFSTIGKEDNYRADIASVISRRIINHNLIQAERASVTDNTVRRLSDIITENIFTNDLTYTIVREIINGNRVKFQKLLMNPEIVKMTIS